MGSFCGFVGKTDKEVADSMVETLNKNCEVAPICFSDGYIHLGYVPFMDSENNQIGHNADFTIWVIVDCGQSTAEFAAEAIIKQYERQGVSFAKELDGTFAIVLWDGIRKRVYLIRDRYGAKPLFYAKTKEGFAFSSEIKPVLQCDGVGGKMNTAAVYRYLSFQSVYLPETVYEGVYHIQPGCYGIYAEGKFEEKEYANLVFGEKSEDGFEEAALKIQTLLQNSVRKCVYEDNTGVFLSGGLDSSLVTVLAEEGKIKHSFCLKPVTCKGTIHKKDEDEYFSSQLADNYGIKHHVWEITAQDLITDIDEIIGSFAQPFSGTMSTYFLAKNTSGLCKRILTGDGADELFGSYRHHSVTMPLQRYAMLKTQGESVAGKETELAPYDKMIPFLENLYSYGGTNDTLWYYRLLQMGDAEKSIFLNRDMFGEYIDEQRTLRECLIWDKDLKSKGVLDRSLERDFKHLLPGYTMSYQDTLGRKFGISYGMPFMDNKLTEYVAALPQEYKIKEGLTKAVLREAGRGILPEEIMKRRKEPFSLPVTEWLKTDLKEYLTDILSVDLVKRYGLLNENCVQYAMKEFYKYPHTKEYYGGMLWTLAMLQQWAVLYL